MSMSDVLDDEEQPEGIEKAEDYISKRRLKSVFDLRQEIHKTRKKLRMAEYQGNSRFEILCGYRVLVESYLLEVEPLLRRYGDGDHYLHEKEFGEVSVEPQIRRTDDQRVRRGEFSLYFPNQPAEYGDRWFRVEWEADLPEAITYDVTGLDSLMSVPSELAISDTISCARGPVSGSETEVRSYLKRSQIPMGILDEMVRTINEFLSDIGFELEPEEEDNPVHIGV